MKHFFQVKYLGEDGVNTHVVGAAAVCCPWDLLVCIFMCTNISFFVLINSFKLEYRNPGKYWNFLAFLSWSFYEF